MCVTAYRCSPRVPASRQSRSCRLHWVLGPTRRSSPLPKLPCSTRFRFLTRGSCGFWPTRRTTDHWYATIGAISIPTVSAALSSLLLLIRCISNCATAIIALAISSHVELSQFEHLSATIDGHAEVVTAELVSGNFFQGMGVGTVLGRPIEPADDTVPGSGAVTVISDSLWQRRFDRSPAVIGKAVDVNLTPDRRSCARRLFRRIACAHAAGPVPAP
jgi:MacB-like periplasmic core domain